MTMPAFVAKINQRESEAGLRFSTYWYIPGSAVWCDRGLGAFYMSHTHACVFIMYVRSPGQRKPIRLLQCNLSYNSIKVKSDILRNSHWPQISWNLIRPLHLFKLSNRFEKYRTWQYHCWVLCKILKRLDNRLKPGQTQFRGIWVLY